MQILRNNVKQRLRRMFYINACRHLKQRAFDETNLILNSLHLHELFLYRLVGKLKLPDFDRATAPFF